MKYLVLLAIICLTLSSMTRAEEKAATKNDSDNVKVESEAEGFTLGGESDIADEKNTNAKQKDYKKPYDHNEDRNKHSVEEAEIYHWIIKKYMKDDTKKWTKETAYKPFLEF